MPIANSDFDVMMRANLRLSGRLFGCFLVALLCRVSRDGVGIPILLSVAIVKTKCAISRRIPWGYDDLQ